MTAKFTCRVNGRGVPVDNTFPDQDALRQTALQLRRGGDEFRLHSSHEFMECYPAPQSDAPFSCQSLALD